MAASAEIDKKMFPEKSATFQISRLYRDMSRVRKLTEKPLENKSATFQITRLSRQYQDITTSAEIDRKSFAREIRYLSNK